MPYNGRLVMKEVAYDSGWTAVRNLVPGYDVYSSGEDSIVIGWNADNSAHYVGINEDTVTGPLALIEARRFIERRAS